MRQLMSNRLAIVLGLIFAAGFSFFIGFAGATLMTRSAGTIDTEHLGTTFDAAERNLQAGSDAVTPAAAAASHDTTTPPAGSEELDAGTTTVAIVCLGILLIALLGVLRDRRRPNSIVVARYSRRDPSRR